MSDYRRYYVPGTTYFFTVVTDRRTPLFSDATAHHLLGSVFRRCILRQPTTVLAIVLLPDHLHCLWTLPTGDSDYSTRWRWLQRRVFQTMVGIGRRRTIAWRIAKIKSTDAASGNDASGSTRSATKSDCGAPRRLHPLQSGASCLGDATSTNWPWSSFHRWVRAGHYQPTWAGGSILADVAGE